MFVAVQMVERMLLANCKGRQSERAENLKKRSNYGGVCSNTYCFVDETCNHLMGRLHLTKLFREKIEEKKQQNITIKTMCEQQ